MYAAFANSEMESHHNNTGSGFKVENIKYSLKDSFGKVRQCLELNLTQYLWQENKKHKNSIVLRYAQPDTCFFV